MNLIEFLSEKSSITENTESLVVAGSRYDVEMDSDDDRLHMRVFQNGMDVGEIIYENGEIIWVHVEPDFRKLGMGSAMIRYLQDHGHQVVMPDARTGDGRAFFDKLSQHGKLDEAIHVGVPQKGLLYRWVEPKKAFSNIDKDSLNPGAWSHIIPGIGEFRGISFSHDNHRWGMDGNQVCFVVHRELLSAKKIIDIPGHEVYSYTGYVKHGGRADGYKAEILDPNIEPDEAFYVGIIKPLHKVLHSIQIQGKLPPRLLTLLTIYSERHGIPLIDSNGASFNTNYYNNTGFNQHKSARADMTEIITIGDLHDENNATRTSRMRISTNDAPVARFGDIDLYHQNDAPIDVYVFAQNRKACGYARCYHGHTDGLGDWTKVGHIWMNPSIRNQKVGSNFYRYLLDQQHTTLISDDFQTRTAESLWIRLACEYRAMLLHDGNVFGPITKLSQIKQAYETTDSSGAEWSYDIGLAILPTKRIKPIIRESDELDEITKIGSFGDIEDDENSGPLDRYNPNLTKVVGKLSSGYIEAVQDITAKGQKLWFFVDETTKEPFGYAIGAIIERNGVHGFITKIIWIEPEYRGHGLASSYYEWILDDLGLAVFSDTEHTPESIQVWSKLVCKYEVTDQDGTPIISMQGFYDIYNGGDFTYLVVLPKKRTNPMLREGVAIDESIQPNGDYIEFTIHDVAIAGIGVPGRMFSIESFSSLNDSKRNTIKALTWLKQKYNLIQVDDIGLEPNDSSWTYWVHMKNKGLVDVLLDSDGNEIIESLREDDGPFDWSKPTTFYRGIVDPAHAEQPFTGTRLGVPTFTDDWAVANTYAQTPNNHQLDKGKSDQVYAYRLNIKNPIHLNDVREDVTEANYILKKLGATTVGQGWDMFKSISNITSWRSDGETWYNDGAKFPVEIEGFNNNPTDVYENLNQVFVDHWDHDWPALYCNSNDLADNPQFQKLVKSAGYDGIVIYGVSHVGWDGITDDDIMTGTSYDGRTSMEWRALDPSQIEYLGPAPKGTITESLTSVLPFTSKPFHNMVNYEFSYKDQHLEVLCNPKDGYIEFTDLDHQLFRPTGKGGGIPIMSTVLAILHDFIDSHPIKKLEFYGDIKSGLSDLYSQMVRTLAKRYGYKYTISPIRKNELLFRVFIGSSMNETINNLHTPNQIAQKHGITIAAISHQLLEGIRIERQHTKTNAEARQIVLERLWQTSDYYDRQRLIEGPAVPLRVTPTMISRARGQKCQIIADIPIDQFLKMTTSGPQLRHDIDDKAKSVIDYNRWAKMGHDPDINTRFNNLWKAQHDQTSTEPYDPEWGNDLMPWLDIRLNPDGSVGTVVSHEGRHRGAASMRIGAKTMRVALRLHPGRDMFPDVRYGEDYMITQEHLPKYVVGQFDKDLYRTDGWKIIDGDLQKATRDRMQL